jgi:hypothetical protein
MPRASVREIDPQTYAVVSQYSGDEGYEAHALAFAWPYLYAAARPLNPLGMHRVVNINAGTMLGVARWQSAVPVTALTAYSTGQLPGSLKYCFVGTEGASPSVYQLQGTTMAEISVWTGAANESTVSGLALCWSGGLGGKYLLYVQISLANTVAVVQIDPDTMTETGRFETPWGVSVASRPLLFVADDGVSNFLYMAVDEIPPMQAVVYKIDPVTMLSVATWASSNLADQPQVLFSTGRMLGGEGAVRPALFLNTLRTWGAGKGATISINAETMAENGRRVFSTEPKCLAVGAWFDGDWHLPLFTSAGVMDSDTLAIIAPPVPQGGPLPDEIYYSFYGCEEGLFMGGTRNSTTGASYPNKSVALKRSEL